MEAYLPILRSLRDAGVEYAAIGTWALKIMFRDKMPGYVLRDCDVVLAPNETNIMLAVRLLNAAGWATCLWGIPVNDATNFSEFAGKYYVRATQGELVLDLTYHCMIPWEAMWSQMQVASGVHVASLTHILSLKRYKAIESGTIEALETWLADRGLEAEAPSMLDQSN